MPVPIYHTSFMQMTMNQLNRQKIPRVTTTHQLNDIKHITKETRTTTTVHTSTKARLTSVTIWIAAKLKNRNNLLTKLAGSSWGADADTLRTSTLALCYSAGEYCAPVWCRSAHTGLVDAQLNSTMHLISGTLRLTPLPWLPDPANIEPPALRRKAATDRLVAKASAHESWPLHHDISNPPQLRLPSRKPLWREIEPVDINSQQRESWKSASLVNAHLVDDPTIRQPGFALP